MGDSPPTAKAYARQLKKQRAKFIKSVREYLRDELEFSFRLVSEGWRALGGLSPHSESDQIMAAFAIECMDLYDAMVHMAAQGRPAPTLVLWRPLFERMLVIHWVSLHPEEAPVRLQRRNRLGQLIGNRIARELPDVFFDQVPYDDATDDEEVKLTREFGKWGERGVTGRRIHELVDEVAATLDAQDAYDLIRCHRLIYAQSNEKIHASTSIFGGGHDELLRVSGELPEAMDCRFTLFAGMQTLSRTLDVIQAQMHPDCVASLRSIRAEGDVLFGEHLAGVLDANVKAHELGLKLNRLVDEAIAARAALSEANEDDPCSCGSGSRYRDCCREYHALIEPYADSPKLANEEFRIALDDQENPL